ncbi:MAG: PQQ-dependent sugar dehydrogenase, partial [Bacteroidota bacterium]
MPKQRMLLLLFGLLLGSIFRLSAQTLGMNFYLEPFPATGAFNQPVGAAFAPDGRMFVIEKGGKVFIVKNGTKLTTPFLDLENEVLNHHDRGLLGIALDPDFGTNGFVYLLYTYSRTGTDANHGTWARLTRYTASAANPDVADLASRWVMIGDTWSDGMISIGVTHTIGSVRFGSDGTLLLTVGDGGEFDAGGNNPWAFGAGKFDPLDDIGRHRSQYLESMSGKVLRIDPATALGVPSNPFYTGNPIDYQSKVWTYGVRNPYRMSVDVFEGKSDPTQGDPGTLYLADVGEGTYEEMNIIPNPGMNFGWPCDEGPGPYPGGQNGNPAHTPCVSGATYDAPNMYFHHFLPNLSSPAGITGSAIIGGQRYRGNRYPANFKGQLFMGEYTEGWLAHVMLDSSYQMMHFHKFGENFPGLVGVEYDPFGDYLYTIDIATGTVSRLRHNQETENAAPIAQASVQPNYGYAPLSVQFQASNSYDPNGDPFSYLWKFGDGDTSHQANPSHVYQNNGVYPVRLTLTDAFGDSSIFISEVQVGNTPPVAQMLSPLPEAIFLTQDSITVSGIATDAEDPETNLTYEWKVTQIHNDHQHPDFFAHIGKTATFSYEEHGYPFEVYFAQIELIVSDPGGLRDTVSRLVPISKEEESDITSEGTAIAKITTPQGSGSPLLAVIHDSIFPPQGSTDPLLQYDTYQLAGGSGEDWVGYEFSTNRYFSRLTFQEGIHAANGGWLEDLWVEVRQAGQWIPVSFLTVFQPYAGEAAADFSLYHLDFRAETGDAIRLMGTPGGSSQFLSVAELRVHALPYQSGTPLITYFYPSTGDIGTEVTILGENFSSTSTVQFNAAFVDS